MTPPGAGPPAGTPAALAREPGEGGSPQKEDAGRQAAHPAENGSSANGGGEAPPRAPPTPAGEEKDEEWLDNLLGSDDEGVGGDDGEMREIDLI